MCIPHTGLCAPGSSHLLEASSKEQGGRPRGVSGRRSLKQEAGLLVSLPGSAPSRLCVTLSKTGILSTKPFVSSPGRGKQPKRKAHTHKKIQTALLGLGSNARPGGFCSLSRELPNVEQVSPGGVEDGPGAAFLATVGPGAPLLVQSGVVGRGEWAGNRWSESPRDP